jgi:hypothetical protein
MPPALRRFLTRHPLVCDAIVWALPAILLGAIIRVLLISYLPYALWGADSRSYYSFAHQLLANSYITLDEKRRYLYPILMLFVSVLPGSPLRWVAFFQHALGLVTLVPLAYVVRKNFVFWRLWVMPVTGLFTCLPVMVWYEHEVLGETVFFSMLVWAFAGWTAWVGEARVDRSRRLFWWFFVPLALFLMTKPSGRFVLPGVVVGLVWVAAWRRLSRRHWIALGLLLVATLTVGSKKQGAWLLYTAAFPLTQLDAPSHADYKAQVRDIAAPLALQSDVYYLQDDVPFEFLEKPGEHPERPLWAALDRDTKLKAKIYMDLALEGIRAEPFTFLYFGVQRAVASANLSSFNVNRFEGDYYRKRFEHHYESAQKEENSAVRLALGLPRRGPLSDYADFVDRIAAPEDPPAEKFVHGWMEKVGESLDFTVLPKGPVEDRKITHARPTLLGLCLCAGALLSVLLPRYRNSLGVWTILGAGYIMGVFLVSQTNARYFAPVWPILVVLLAVPADALARAIFARLSRP